MRLSKVLELGEELGDKRQIILRELRVSDIHNAVGMADELKRLEIRALADPAKLNGILALLGDCVAVQGCGVEDLTFSEIMAAFATFREVNAAFFGILAMVGVDLAMGISATGGGSLSAPAALSSSVDTPESSDTAGASS